ncbi:MAG TPA: 16S rRNA (guanine(527)-N(7))-methyltransferase RsmG [Rectinemataceae bacterium]|nr:16S rRNA (guanine(527)-N(7))-methyltransferase RsmG [Rectinemataceae bacterium]
MEPSAPLLDRGLEALGLPPSGELRDRLSRYIADIEAWNPAYGLVGASGDELVVKHILDSLAAVSLIRALAAEIAAARGSRAAFGLSPTRLSLADLGTGAGLPGIPLALALGELDVALVDRMGKRIRFLENQKAALGLANVTVVESEVERAPGRYDILTFRAFRPFERKLFTRVFALCESDGMVVAYKGRREKAAAELSEIEGLFSAARIEPITVPFLAEERCLVLLRP